jgi:hypothetical protein
VGAERDVDADVLARGHELVPALRPQPVEHLELVARGRDLVLARVGEGILHELLVVGGDRGVVPAVEKHPSTLLEALADVVHVRPGDRLGLAIGALAEAHAVAAPHRFRHVLRRTVEIGLEHDPDAVVRPAQRVEDVDRVLRELRAFHVEPYEASHRLRDLEDGRGLLEAEVSGDRLSHRGELDRDVAVHTVRHEL